MIIYNAINSLGNIGDPRALKELRKWAKKKNIRPEVNQIAMESVNKLKQIKFTSTPLSGGLSSPKYSTTMATSSASTS